MLHIHKLFRALPTLFAVTALFCATSPARAQEDHWVATWACGPQLTEPGNLPRAPLANSSLRQFIHVTVGGQHLRARFSNTYGTNAVAINAAHVALAAGLGSAGNGEINPATDKPLTFHGAPSVTIPPGEFVLSDPLDFNLPPLTKLAITILFGDISATTITGHPGSRTTSYILPGDQLAAPSFPAATTATHWYIITGLDVLEDNPAKCIVTLGDSITDGRGSTTDGNDRWPDQLALRIASNAPTSRVAVVNTGIGGNGLFAGLGPPALARFNRDCLQQSGVRWLIVFEGVNDIGGASTSRSAGLATDMIAAYGLFIDEAHAHHLRVYGATITPFGGNNYYTTAHENARQTVNHWIRTSGAFDAVIDFDAAVRDPATQTNLAAPYNSGDGLHLNPAGYQAMAAAIDLSLFTQ